MINRKYYSIAAATLGITSSALLIAGSALAQDAVTTEKAANKSGEKQVDLEEIVVTGTLVRGAAPVGTNVIAVTQGDVQATGAATTAQLMQSIPQLASFNSLQFPAGGGNAATSNRPNLRGLPGFNTAGGASTLVLMDGHRLVGMGIQSTTADVDAIPPGVIERVEVVPDGGSAIYGSDAVAGVINFITRKNFDGMAFDARYGTAADFHTFDANATGGHSWGSGSAYLSYNYSEHGTIFGRDRDFVKTPPQLITGAPGVQTPVQSLRCSPGNVQVSALGATGFAAVGVFGLPYGAGTSVASANTAHQCDESDNTSIYPKENRHSVFVGGSQELSDSITLDVRGYYMKRQLDYVTGQFVSNQNLGPAFLGGSPSPFYAAHVITGVSALQTHSVSFAWDAPDAARQNIAMDTWGIAPAITAELGGSWQLRGLANYGESHTESHAYNFNPATLANAIGVGLFNPYDPAMIDPDPTSGPTAADYSATRAALANSETLGLSRQRLTNVRTIVDGNLLTLPGGEIKLAAGLEYTKENLRAQKGVIVPGTKDTGYSGLSINGSTVVAAQAPLKIADLSRNVKSAFAELVVPIFGSSNKLTGLDELAVSASGRYDDYSDFGDTFNPKFGLTYKPLEWIKLRAAWGKSFVAPSLADAPSADATAVTFLTGVQVAGFFSPPPSLIANGTYPAVGPTQAVVVVQGNAPGIKPQTAKTWSYGIDIDPPVVPGLFLNLTYWQIKYQGVIAVPPFFSRNVFWANFLNTPAITVAPSLAAMNALIASSDIPTAPCTPLPGCVYALVDARKTNLGDYNVDGLDFAANYTHPTGFGSMDFSLSATYDLKREQSPVAGAAFSDLLAANQTRFRGRVTAGAQIGQLRAQASLNHTGGYRVNPPVGVAAQQTRVSSYSVVNLFFKYDVNGAGIFKDLSFTLGVDNVMDKDPPAYQQQSLVQSSQGYINGLTVGRLFQFGIGKQFGK